MYNAAVPTGHSSPDEEKRASGSDDSSPGPSRCWVSVSSKIGHGGEPFRGREHIRNSNKRKIRAAARR